MHFIFNHVSATQIIYSMGLGLILDSNLGFALGFYAYGTGFEMGLLRKLGFYLRLVDLHALVTECLTETLTGHWTNSS